MRRRELIALMGAGVALPFAAMAQEPGRTYRLGVLFSSPRNDGATPAFFEGVQRQGFIEGQNLILVYHAFAQQANRIPEWIAELVNAHVDVIATVGDQQFVPHRRRLRPFRSLRLQTTCSGPV
jgi:hypothetical protein